jgi:predicted TIM-barrel fold metal-dependent hydrolase
MSSRSRRRSHSGISRREWLAASAAATLATTLAHGARAGDITLDDDDVAPDYAIWDNHCHLSGVTGDEPAERMAALLAYADRFGIERLVVYMGWPFALDPDPAELRRQNDQVLTAIEGREDRVLAYAYVSGNHPEASLAEMRRLVERGPMVGIKLWVARRCDDAAVDAIVSLATQFDAVVFQHTWLKTTGNLAGESTPDDLAKLAARHPRARLICGHAGGRWEQGIRTIRAHKNIALGTAGCDPTTGLVEMAVRELGAERVIYGSDAGGRSFASQLAKVLGAPLDDAQRRLILGGNLRRMLKPIMTAKALVSG